MKKNKIAVVIPCFNVKNKILQVISSIGPEVDHIYVIDDKCPEKSGIHVKNNSTDKRVKVIFSPINLGVGGAVMLGYKNTPKDVDVIVKIDGDGQMDASLIMDFVRPIIINEADYTKGNRFYDLEKIRSMPILRIVGNTVLSFLTKASSGYWNIFDPNNGFTAIHAEIIRKLPFEKINNRFFFESDMLFRLNTLKAVVIDIPMEAIYGDEKSNLVIHKVFFPFLYHNFLNLIKRIFYNYYLRDMSIASFELPIGILLLFFGLIFGSCQWMKSIEYNIPTSVGTVMIAVLPIIIGGQLLLSFIGYDINSVPRRPIHKPKHKL